ncbi:MAG: transposase [Candidatus Scalindua rubra]|uniref:Transposase n=1 Tax=Candidatus Scalindua rubra TaxID=1872076 RepID=A0A1E3XFW4_9BACT|nr:MAG: transposase [Candidatus Scalindua rubra]
MKVYYIGMDVHKKNISYCIKTKSGEIVSKGNIASNRASLRRWVRGLPKRWIGAMEATLFSGWIYDYLKPYALELKVANPQMLKAIIASKKKNDRVDAQKIADLLRCNLLPECYMAPEKIRELRRVLRYRNLMVREAVRMNNKMSGLFMEVGAVYSKKRLHGKKYFSDLLERVEDVPDSVIDLLRLSRASYEMFNRVQKKLMDALNHEPLIADRVKRLMTIDGVGEVTALTWVLEVGDPMRFGATGQAISYCGLCSAQRESAGKNHRGPISKQRNKHLQTVLIEAAKLAPHWNAQLAKVHEREVKKGNCNRATLAVARKLVSYMLAVDKRGTEFVQAAEAKAA